MRRKGGIDKVGRLLTKDSFVKMTIEEGILNVELMDRSGMRSYDAKEARMVASLMTGLKVLS